MKPTEFVRRHAVTIYTLAALVVAVAALVLNAVAVYTVTALAVIILLLLFFPDGMR